MAACKSAVTPNFLLLGAEVWMCTENCLTLLNLEVKVLGCFLSAGSDVLQSTQILIHFTMQW